LKDLCCVVNIVEGLANMQKEDLKKKIVESVKNKDGNSSLLKFLLSEYERQEFAGNKVTVEQIVRKCIASNNECIALRNDENLAKENEFLKTLLPNYLTIDELRSKLEPLGLDSSGKSIGQAIKYLKANGLNYINEDIVLALKTHEKT
jgi:hypothetical protein